MAVKPKAPAPAAIAEPAIVEAAIAAPAIPEPADAEPETQAAPPIPAPGKMEQAMKTPEDFVAFGQANVEAFVKAGQIWSAGFQDLSKQAVALAQAQVDETLGAFKALSGVKTFKDAVDMQANFARAAFEKSVAEQTKLTDASLKLTEQAIAPIAARVTVAMDKAMKAA